MKNYTCPVCEYSGLDLPPEDFTICPSCGTEFGYDDVEYELSELKFIWIKNGRKWWSENTAPSPNKL